MAKLSAWQAGGAHRRDLDKNGKDDEGDAVALMDAWFPRLVQAEFQPALGLGAYAALSDVVKPQSVGPGDEPAAPDYDDGWFSFVHKDLRDQFAKRGTVRGRWSRGYCGGGKKVKCRKALVDSLRQSLGPALSPGELYGKGDCAQTPDAACFDQNRSTVASAIGVPPFPFQNRPTFQQTVELTRTLPR
jgi:hypothetical protein